MPTNNTNSLLISYDTHRKRFKTLYERNKFYRGLFGYKQTVKENGKVYKYEKDGLIGRIPHIKVAESVFIIASHNSSPLTKYLDQWTPKVTYTTYNMSLTEKTYKDIDKNVSITDIE